MQSYVNDFSFAKRTSWSLQHNPLTELLEKLRSQGISILDLTESNPTRCGFEYPLHWLDALSLEENLIYTPAAEGMPTARQAIADYYNNLSFPHVLSGNPENAISGPPIKTFGGDKGSKLDPQRVVLTSSTSEGYSFLLKLLTNPGDHILIPKPSYPLFQFLLELHDVEFNYYPLAYDGNWSINQKVFKSLITRRTRAVIVVNPNNPTGSYISRQDMEFLNEQCLKNHMAIISDEVFFDYKFNVGCRDEATCGERSRTMPRLYNNNDVLTFTLSGISKILGLPQMKLAWIVVHGPEVLVKAAMQRLEVVADTYLSVNTPVQNALPTWLAQSAKIQKQILQRVRENLEILRRGTAWELLSAEGGWYAVMQVPSIQSEEQFVLNLLDKEHVLVHPGYFFDFEKGGFLVISLLPKTEILAEAIERIYRRIQVL